MADLGTIVIGGVTFQITRLELKNARLVITAERHGKAAGLTDETITIFGQDGRGFGQGGTVSIERAGRWSTTEVTVSVRMMTLTDDSA